MSEKLIVKNDKIQFKDYLFIGFHTPFLVVGIVEMHALIICVFAFALCLWIYFMVDRIKDKSVRLILDNRGIRLCDRNKFIYWEDITAFEIRRGTNRDTIWEYLKAYLFITIVVNMKSRKLSKIDMSDYQKQKKLIQKFAKKRIKNGY